MRIEVLGGLKAKASEASISPEGGRISSSRRRKSLAGPEESTGAMQPPVAADDPTIEVPPLPAGGRHVIVITEVPYQTSKVWTLSHLG